ncbi:MAG: hypothetical protein H0V33_11945 [Acidimicrobiia bacterium]|nr:hypothetical protein [Acidimicrobiia bacterium]
MTRSPVLELSVRFIFLAAIIGSLYLLFAGHNQPGGGFVGGLVAGAAVALRYVFGGIDEVRSLTPFQPWTILGVGLLVAAVTATVPLAFGHDVIEVSSATLELPVGFATLKATSALPFDAGVYLLVLGLVFMVFEAFGDDDVDTAADGGTSP